ncbi:MAG: DUF374 domain-containing protein [Aestuariivita sp.]|nr:DUF374 domain-containing protein [Aestuariivita sp.]MCY4202433.1 DUF374 domain-containing protein [Aestuariivita sp.]MCY4288627.1 DUF374 domain-containing protein [Aestuariivita sp.]MCY4345601.1 DUF374 domain-containing protein [Aestuariivita sp.]
MGNLRRRVADNPRFNRSVENSLAAYLKFAFRTSDFDRLGFEDMDACVARGEPVIMVLWHQRLVMAGFAFPTHLGKVSSLTTSKRAGRLAGQVLNRFGFDTVAMPTRRPQHSLSREVMRRVDRGSSIGIAADGPRGPKRIANNVTLVWARTLKLRVFAISFSANRVLKLPTWDRLMLPLPWSRGVIQCREWTETVPRNPSVRELERLRTSLNTTLNAVTDDSDRNSHR